MGNCVNKSDSEQIRLSVSVSESNQENNKSENVITNVLIKDELENIQTVNNETIHNNSIDSNNESVVDYSSVQNNKSTDMQDDESIQEITNVIPCFNNLDDSENNIQPVKSIDEEQVSTPTVHFGQHITIINSDSFDRQEYE